MQCWWYCSIPLFESHKVKSIRQWPIDVIPWERTSWKNSPFAFIGRSLKIEKVCWRSSTFEKKNAVLLSSEQCSMLNSWLGFHRTQFRFSRIPFTSLFPRRGHGLLVMRDWGFQWFETTLIKIWVLNGHYWPFNPGLESLAANTAPMEISMPREAVSCSSL